MARRGNDREGNPDPSLVEDFDARTEPVRWNPDQWGDDPVKPFFDQTHPSDAPYWPAFQIRDRVIDGSLRAAGFGPGDPIPVTWENEENGETMRMWIRLPKDWRRHDAWTEFYREMREFFYGIWNEISEGDYEYDRDTPVVGSATTG